MTGVRVLVDTEVCAGHGRCYSMHPRVFDSDDAGYPIVGEPTDLDAGTDAEDAVYDCPEGAISLIPVPVTRQ